MATDTEPAPYGTEAARKALFELLKSPVPVEITRESGDRIERALLTPLTALSEQQRAALPSWPAHGLTQARQALGSLVGQAAAGAPQRLRRRTQDVAVLLPASGTVTTPPPAAPPSSTATGPGASAPARRRRLTAPATALDALTSSERTSLSYGLPAVDDATGGLLPGRLALIAAAPGVGGSLLAASAARAAAIVHGRTVLYAASGPSATDVTARIAASHAGANYQLLRSGTLDAPADIRAALEEARTAPLLVDDGADLDVAAIEETLTADELEGLALLVVDRLQTAGDPAVPLSGEALPAVTRALVRLARHHDLPVLAALDSDDASLLGSLQADVVLRLEREREGEAARLTVTDADFGGDPHGGAVRLYPDFLRARFVDTPFQPSAPPQTPVPAPASPAQPSTPGSPRPAAPANAAPAARPATSRSGGVDSDVIEQIRATVVAEKEKAGGDADAALKALIKRAVPDVMAWFDLSRKGGRYEHSSFPPVNDLLKKTGQKSGADAVWEGRQNWKNMALRGADAAPREVVALDANAAYLAAFKTHLPMGQLVHDTSGAFDPKRAGIHLLTPPAWDHADLPSPLGERKTAGDVWITDPTLRLFQRCARGGLCEQPTVKESWTSGASENVLEKLRRTLAQVRHEAIEAGDDVTVEYLKSAYSKFISTMGESTYNREIRRPDWMHILRSQAYANLWLKAHRAHRAGLLIAEVTGTDELHVVGPWQEPFEEGRDLAQMKLKHTYILGGSA